MNYKLVLLSFITIIGLSSCGSGESNGNVQDVDFTTENQQITQPNQETKTVVNNEAINFPNNTVQSAPTDQLVTN